jgi:hypothetical protein
MAQGLNGLFGDVRALAQMAHPGCGEMGRSADFRSSSGEVADKDNRRGNG